MEVLVIGYKYFDSTIANNIVNTIEGSSIIRWSNELNNYQSKMELSISIIDRVMKDKNITDLVISHSMPAVLFHIAYWLGNPRTWGNGFGDRISIYVINKDLSIEKVNTKSEFPEDYDEIKKVVDTRFVRIDDSDFDYDKETKCFSKGLSKLNPKYPKLENVFPNNFELELKQTGKCLEFTLIGFEPDGLGGDGILGARYKCTTEDFIARMINDYREDYR